MLPDRTNLTELVAAGPLKFSMDSALSRRVPQLLTESEQLKGAGRNEGQFLSCSDHYCIGTTAHSLVWFQVPHPPPPFFPLTSGFSSTMCCQCCT